MADFLFEIGLEEIPARMIDGGEAELARRLRDLLARERLLSGDGEVRRYSTPRRLAVQIPGVLLAQEDVAEQVIGPSWKVAFKDGAPTPAAVAFAKKAGVEVEALEKVTNAKGDYVSAKVTKAGRSAAEILREALPRELAQIYWAKSMYWRAGKPERFVRPVRWMVALLDGAVIPVEFGGVTAGRSTYGHRVLFGDAPIELERPQDYVGRLEAAFVLPQVDARRHRIRKELDRVTRTVAGARWREDEALVETVTQLTEWPSVVLGSFDGEYLALPDEVLVTVMRDHQKYFAVEDAEHTLLPHFLAVLNTQVDASGLEIIRHGNERVLRARFNDARFFWDFDQKVPLTARTELLKSVTFQKDLGSYWKKTETNARLADALATRVEERGVHFNRGALSQAVLLAKADLTTEMVKEFTELQGIVGGLYARAQGLGDPVAEAIYWQYRPASTDDAVPPTIEGKLLGLADRMATIADMFALGLEPTGSKDPFALRRAANAVIKILAGGDVPLTLGELEALATSPEQNALAETATSAVGAFLRERLEFFLRDVLGYAYDVVKAVLAAGADDVPDAMARAEALTAVRGSEDFLAISTAFKRIKNILRQAEERDDLIGQYSQAHDTQEEAALWGEMERTVPNYNQLCIDRNYPEALKVLASIRTYIDRYFETVMVMAEDTAVRARRLGTIQYLYTNFSRIADFSEIVVS